MKASSRKTIKKQAKSKAKASDNKGRLKRARGEKQAKTKAKASGRKAKASENKGKSKTTHSQHQIRTKQSKQAMCSQGQSHSMCSVHVAPYRLLHACCTMHVACCKPHPAFVRLPNAC